MRIYTPMLDWITVTTYDAPGWETFREILSDLGSPHQKHGLARRMQYQGLENDGIFIGEARQRGRPHYMLQASGEIAQAVGERLHGGKCTRIDLQVTVVAPEDYNARDVYDAIAEWAGPGRPRRPQLIQGPGGFDTVYCGSRQSESFIRIYVKPALRTNVLRFEVEYKGTKAGSVWEALRAKTTKIGAILAAEVQCLPWLPFGLKSAYFLACGATPGERPVTVIENAEPDTLKWLRQSAGPAIIRLANSHESRTVTLAWLRAIMRECRLDDSPFDIEMQVL